ncbi:response regulator transcription factor [Clostridium aciditolerans]|uniref:Stage 0 sporulation protein A homolog n=1 Tax=Clostridium aciditolerans TaxID=339861 RepID=A0A934HXX7_9CLOT|nr:response regulator transcription factor [Clostridium aciditolerans]MBI6871556.1 response regulator transcription factor [Clostridium aciditolerans]
MYKLLLVEDDESLALGIEFTLKDEGYELCRASTISEAENLLRLNQFDLILLDVNLPDGNGYELCKSIRTKSDIPIIFLTACDDEVNIVLGLEIGGDDYITKPFRVRELLSRIKASLRRSSKISSIGNKLISGNIVVDNVKAIVKKKDKEVILTAQEYRLLLIFMNKPKVLIKRDEILNELTEGAESFFDENTLSVYIKRIREKIEDSSKDPEYIVTLRGLGYKWDKDVVKE